MRLVLLFLSHRLLSVHLTIIIFFWLFICTVRISFILLHLFYPILSISFCILKHIPLFYIFYLSDITLLWDYIELELFSFSLYFILFLFVLLLNEVLSFFEANFFYFALLKYYQYLNLDSIYHNMIFYY